ncbi:MAG: DNA-processing protein DprA [Proteobacteria bacterium]|nr:DNA-processing protein DprA [Pseudomonadota bacterium]
MTTKEAFIALNLIEHVGPVRVRQLLDHFGEAPAILQANKQQLLQVRGIGEDTADAIGGWESNVDLTGELKRISDFGCHVLTQADAEYPELLREIYDPPIVLYVKGTLTAKDKNSVALVGSRQTTSYGIETARKLAYQLAYVGVTVVSGGARGIDTATHQGALAAKGRTIAVLGTGINLVFPPENAELFERMNLSSGALITANFATDYGRQVFAVPGRIDSPRSKGCHDLIKKGAKLCEGAEDILSEFEYLFPASNKPASPAETGVLPALSLSENETKILAAVAQDETHIDEVIRASGLPASAVSVGLLSLEMKRMVRQLPGKIFVRVR